MADLDSVIDAIDAATDPSPEAEARFALVVADDGETDAVVDALRADLAPLGAVVEQRSARELLLVIPDHGIVDETAAFRAADALVAAYPLEVAEPEIFFTAMPVDLRSDEPELEGLADMLGCWVGKEPALTDKRWAIEKIRVPQAWAFADARGRPSRGEGVVVAQPDTGTTRHRELEGVTVVSPRNFIGARKDDPTDPMTGGNVGHGTSTGSVVLSPETLDMSGSAPRARHMPIRAIENVARLSQIKVAEAIDYAVDHGAHVITMSLGGVASVSLWRALARAVEAGVVVVAAAGNCVKFVVWPARYEKCIAVAGVDSGDRVWQGSCTGSAVDISAPAQNVYRATAQTGDVGQGEGTSYAVALVAGVAACWLAFHGRANLIAEARSRGETLQEMFRRLLKATARVPAGWDGFNMGAGVVDAEALLKADLDLGRGTEGPTRPVATETPGWSVRSLAYEKIGPEAATSDLDWQRHGAEISLALLRRRIPETPAEAGAILESLAPLLTPADPGRPRRPEPRPSAAPAIRRPRPEAAPSERVLRQRRIITARAAVEEHGNLESTVSEEAMAQEPLTKRGADATIERVVSLAERMPAREVRDRQAFDNALKLLTERGNAVLRAFVGARPDADAGVNRADSAVLEAIIIADGSRPSFLLEEGLPPRDHPFMGTWKEKVATARPRLKRICNAIGRIQPRFGHAGNFIGTGCLVDADKGLAITNFHVLDDARSKFGVLMRQQGGIVKIDGWLEIDFLGEASSFDSRRFKVVEARLPANAGRGMGRLDAATLRIEPIDGAEIPDAIAFDKTPQVFNQAAGATFCTVGFPGPPRRDQGPKGEVDWNFVVRTLFGDLFGVKRLAPGRVGKVGGIPSDTLNIVFGHEATTFGGASGSALLAWELDRSPAFGLHFSGATEVSNYAISVGKAGRALEAVGLP